MLTYPSSPIPYSNSPNSQNYSFNPSFKQEFEEPAHLKEHTSKGAAGFSISFIDSILNLKASNLSQN